MEAIISGRAGVALLLDGERTASLRVGAGGSTEPCDLEDFPLLFGDAKDLEFLEDTELPQIAELLAREHSKQQALQLALISLDESLSIRTRRVACEELESLLSAEEIEDFLEKVLHAHVLPPSADLGGVLVILPGKAGRVRKLLRRLEACQTSIASVQYAWQGIPPSLFGGSANHGNARAVAVREGLFRDLVGRCRERGSFETFVPASLAKDAIRDLPNARTLLEKWVALLQLEEGPSYPVGIPLPESSVAEATEPTQASETLPPVNLRGRIRIGYSRVVDMMKRERRLRSTQWSKLVEKRASQAAVRYHGFRLQIVTGPAGGYTVQALSPQGEGQAPFVVPFGSDEPGISKAAFERGALFGRHLHLDDPEEPERSLEALGERLFAALFRGEILRLYERSLDLLEEDPKAGLRLELVLDPRDPGFATLQALPWELMRQPGTAEHLALSRRRPLVRYLDVSRPMYAPRRISKLRVLAVASNPLDEHYLGPLHLAREIRNLKEAVGSTNNLEIIHPNAPTVAALREACFEWECHVLHFMGHGGWEPGRGEGFLFFQAEDGGSDLVRGEDIVNALRDLPALRLVVLNACESAVPSSALRVDSLASVASSLVLGGIPAVVAMQLPMSDQAAIAFSRALYQRLATGEPVEAAVAEGRLAVHSADPEGIEWAAPVLFLSR